MGIKNNMRSLSVCVNCRELEKIYDCNFEGEEITKKRLSGFKCKLTDKRIITRKQYYEKKRCPKDCELPMEQMILSQKKYN